MEGYSITNSSKVQESESNYFLASMLDPFNFPGVKIPTLEIDGSTTKVTRFIYNETVPKDANGTVPDILLMFLPHNPRNRLSLWVRWPIRGITEWSFWKFIAEDQPINGNYTEGMVVTGGIKVWDSVSTRNSDFLKGHINAAQFKTLPSLFGLDPASIPSNARNNRDWIAGQPAHLGVVTPAFPSTIGKMEEFDTVSNYRTGVTRSLTLASFTTIPVGVTDIVAYGALANQSQLPIAGAFALNITGYVQASGNGGSYTLQMDLIARNFDPVTNTVIDQNVSGGYSPRANDFILAQQASTTAGNWERFHYFVIFMATVGTPPVNLIRLTLSGAGGVTIVGNSIGVNLIQYEALTPGYYTDGVLLSLEGLDPESELSIMGVLNWEVVPNRVLQRDIQTSTGGHGDPSDMVVAQYCLGNRMPDPRFRMVYAGEAYADLVRLAAFDTATRYENLDGFAASLPELFQRGMNFFRPVLRAFAPHMGTVGGLIHPALGMIGTGLGQATLNLLGDDEEGASSSGKVRRPNRRMVRQGYASSAEPEDFTMRTFTVEHDICDLEILENITVADFKEVDDFNFSGETDETGSCSSNLKVDCEKCSVTGREQVEDKTFCVNEVHDENEAALMRYWDLAAAGGVHPAINFGVKIARPSKNTALLRAFRHDAPLFLMMMKMLAKRVHESGGVENWARNYNVGFSPTTIQFPGVVDAGLATIMCSTSPVLFSVVELARLEGATKQEQFNFSRQVVFVPIETYRLIITVIRLLGEEYGYCVSQGNTVRGFLVDIAEAGVTFTEGIALSSVGFNKVGSDNNQRNNLLANGGLWYYPFGISMFPYIRANNVVEIGTLCISAEPLTKTVPIVYRKVTVTGSDKTVVVFYINDVVLGKMENVSTERNKFLIAIADSIYYAGIDNVVNYVTIQTKIPLLGESVGLAAYIAAMKYPNTAVYSGRVDRNGNIEPVGDIHLKAQHVNGAGFNFIFRGEMPKDYKPLRDFSEVISGSFNTSPVLKKSKTGEVVGLNRPSAVAVSVSIIASALTMTLIFAMQSTASLVRTGMSDTQEPKKKKSFLETTEEGEQTLGMKLDELDNGDKEAITQQLQKATSQADYEAIRATIRRLWAKKKKVSKPEDTIAAVKDQTNFRKALKTMASKATIFNKLVEEGFMSKEERAVLTQTMQRHKELYAGKPISPEEIEFSKEGRTIYKKFVVPGNNNKDEFQAFQRITNSLAQKAPPKPQVSLNLSKPGLVRRNNDVEEKQPMEEEIDEEEITQEDWVPEDGEF